MGLWASGERLLSGLFGTQKQLSDRDTRRGIRMFTVDGVCSMAMGALQGGPFLAAFALALGASNYEIGLLAAIGFFSQPMQLAGLYLVQRLGRRRGITALAAVLSRIAWVPIILIPVLFVDRGTSFLIHWLLFSALIAAIPGPAWNSLIRDIVPMEKFGRVTSRRMALGTIVALTLTLLGGFFVDWWGASFPGNAQYAYSLLFLSGLGFGLAGIIAISRLPEPVMAADKDTPLRELLAMPIRDSNYRRLLYFVGSWNFALNMATPFFVVYMLRRIEISMSLVTALTVASQVANLMFLRIWGRLADRFSNKSVLSVSCPLFLVAVLAWAFTTMPERYFLTLPLLVAIHILSGMSMAGVTLPAANIALKLAPRGYAHAYMAVFGLAGAVTGAIAPLLGGTLADFFASRELAVSISWSEPGRQLSMYALNFRALDFLFLLAFIVGLYAVHRLTLISEEGEVEEQEIIQELKDEVVSPIRTVSSVGGLRRFAFLPLHRLVRGLHLGGAAGATRGHDEGPEGDLMNSPS